MKNRFIKIVVLVLFVGLLVGCKPNKATINGKEYTFDREFTEFSGEYKIPSDFHLIETGDTYEDNNNKIFELYDSERNLIYKVIIRKISLNISTEPMKEDAKAIEDNQNNTIVDGTNKTYNGTNWGIVKYKTTTEDFGKNTNISTYYGLYDKLGIRLYYRIEFISNETNEEFEDVFMQSFKITD